MAIENKMDGIPPIDACAGEMRVMFSDPFNLGLLKTIDKVPREESRGQDIDYVL